MLVQSWLEPLVYLQTSLDRYDAAPEVIINKTKWVSEKLISLEQGVVVLIKEVRRIPLVPFVLDDLKCMFLKTRLPSFSCHADVGRGPVKPKPQRGSPVPVRRAAGDGGIRDEGLHLTQLLQEGRP